jgi:hypothetical protein
MDCVQARLDEPRCRWQGKKNPTLPSLPAKAARLAPRNLLQNSARRAPERLPRHDGRTERKVADSVLSCAKVTWTCSGPHLRHEEECRKKSSLSLGGSAEVRIGKRFVQPQGSAQGIPTASSNLGSLAAEYMTAGCVALASSVKTV